jgi:homoserine O-acetyltransferase
VCTSAKTSPHNVVFLESLLATLKTDAAWIGDRFTEQPARGLRAFGRIYAGWALSQAFYREKVFLSLGYSSLEDFLIREWEAAFLRRDPANLMSMLETWKRSNISDNDLHRGDLQAALKSIRARTFIMPGSMDLYFTPEDARAECELIPRGEFRPIESIWGHRAGNPAKNPADEAVLKLSVKEMMEE